MIEAIATGMKAVAATLIPAGVTMLAAADVNDHTSVPIGWLIGGVFAVAGASFYLGTVLQRILGRIKTLEDKVAILTGQHENKEED